MLSRLRASQYCTCTCARLIETINWEAEVPEGDSLQAERSWLDGWEPSSEHKARVREQRLWVDEIQVSNVKCRRPIKIKSDNWCEVNILDLTRRVKTSAVK